ncbi:NAD(P)-dependent alcohol dehydrogenase [Leifsonia kafniensis]|uniref:NAD(P)-dependent alcohol dehydrogenase n=1 Tax=Leifsonia kafniensis TaxID=475957 RepID=A0ABP7K1T6_9MICO
MNDTKQQAGSTRVSPGEKRMSAMEQRMPEREKRMSAMEQRMPEREKRMSAMVQHEYGEARDVLNLEQTDRPTLTDDTVIVRVKAAGVDRGAWHLMAGLPYPVRLAGYGVRSPKTGVRGRELAGVVESVGAHVTSVRPGDEVFGIGEGAFAEYVSCRADLLAPKPTRLTMVEAAAVPISALTALQALRDHGRVRAGQKVLIIGAGGGVGSFAVQIAKAMGADVTGVCSTGKVELVSSLGADRVIDYTRSEITDDGQLYDVILDTGGNRSLAMIRKALASAGTLVIVGAETGGRWLGGTERQLRAMALSPWISQRLVSFIASENQADLRDIALMLEAGSIKPAVDRTYPLGDVATAIEQMQAGRVSGKVVITV